MQLVGVAVADADFALHLGVEDGQPLGVVSVTVIGAEIKRRHPVGLRVRVRRFGHRGKAVLLAYRIDGVQHSLLLGRRLRSDRCSRCAGRSAQHRDCRRTDQQRRKEFFRQFHVPSLHEQIFCPALRRALCVVYHRQKSAVNAQIRQKCR